MDREAPQTQRLAREALIVLTGLNLVNYLDRYVVPAVQESIRHELTLNDQQLGLLTTAFMVVYMVVSPIFGWLGDTKSRTHLIGIGVLIWSVATASTGLAATFALILVCRMAVGIGEAAYGTIAPAVLSDYFPKEVRGRVFSVFYAAIPFGSALGYLVGGYVGGHWGWRHAFYFTAVPGALLAILAFRLKDPPRGAEDDDAGAHGHGAVGPGILAAWRTLWESRLYVLAVAGYAAGTFAMGGLGVWLPTFLERERHLSNAAEIAGGMMALSGLLGTVAGGWIGDWYARRSRMAYLWVSGVTSLLAVPVALVALRSPSPAVYLPAIFVASALVFACTGPVNTFVVNVVPPTMRATAVAACTLAIHLFGDASSPYLIGLLSDKSGSLAHAILVVPLALMVSGVVWTWSAWRYRAQG